MIMSFNMFLCKAKFFFQKRQEIISYIIIVSMAFFALSVILYDAEWIFGDNYAFILTTAQGKPAPLLNGINVGNSRFFPLAGLDFNILLFIPGGNTALAHYIYVAFSFILGYLFFFLFNKYFFAKADDDSIRNNVLYITALSCMLLIANSGFFKAFMNVIYSERLIFLLFALMMISFLKGRKTGRVVWFVLAAVSAVYVAYLKETVSPALFAFSFFSLFFFRKEMSKAEKIAHYSIIINFIIFISMWLYFGHTGNGGTYRSDNILPFGIFLRKVLWQHKIYLCILAAAFCRCCAVFFFKSKPVHLADPLLLASATFICEYMVLKFHSDYYYFPAAVLGLPPLLYFIFSLWKKMENTQLNHISLFFRIASICVILISIVGEIPFVSANINADLSERAKVMPGLRQMASLQSHGGKIYWYNPANDLDDICSLVNTYINFINRTDNVDYLVKIDDMPELDRNDVFLYTLNSSTLKIPVYPAILQSLEQNRFVFFQYQTGFLVFMHEDNLKL